MASRIRMWLLTAIAAALYFVVTLATRWVALQASGLQALWLGNALMLGILLAETRNRNYRGPVAAVLAGCALGSIAVHSFWHDPARVTALFTSANLIEVSLAFALLNRFGFQGDLAGKMRNLCAFGFACGAAVLVSATVGALCVWLWRGADYFSAWRSWYVAGVLSLLIVTPAILLAAGIVRSGRLRGLTGRTTFEFTALLGLVGFVAWSVFGGYPLPLTFLVLPVALVATLRFRMVGAIGSVLIVAGVASINTAAGKGPIAGALSSHADQVLLLQAFIATIFFCCLPIAALLAEKDAQGEETRLIAEHFRSVVETIGEVIFRLDANGAWAYLNPAWETLSGRRVDASLGRSWLEQVDPDERRALAERVGAVLRGEQRSTRSAMRLDTPTGFRWVELFVQGLPDEFGHVTGAAGTMRDIDDRKRLEEHVITAKRRAEQRAREATLLASTDELTGIANRRAFMAQLDREIGAATEFGWPLAVAMFDVDHFKSVNDRYGHAVGDRVLQLIAAQAAAVVRGGDLVGRLGGEEFGILMPGATLGEAAVVAERLRGAMECASSDESLPGVTVSVGIAAREEQRTAADLLDAADHALYGAKDEGRNRVRIAA